MASCRKGSTIRDERAIPALVDRVLRDVNAHVRWRALWAIREYDSQEQAKLYHATDDWELFVKKMGTFEPEER